MKKLIEKILTDRSARNITALTLLVMSLVVVGGPWGDR